MHLHSPPAQCMFQRSKETNISGQRLFILHTAEKSLNGECRDVSMRAGSAARFGDLRVGAEVGLLSAWAAALVAERGNRSKDAEIFTLMGKFYVCIVRSIPNRPYTSHSRVLPARKFGGDGPLCALPVPIIESPHIRR